MNYHLLDMRADIEMHVISLITSTIKLELAAMDQFSQTNRWVHLSPFWQCLIARRFFQMSFPSNFQPKHLLYLFCKFKTDEWTSIHAVAATATRSNVGMR